jgi:lipopolysaccharide export system permease protein
LKILNRYVLKEHAGPLGFALTALTSLLLLNYIAKQFGNLVGKGLPWTVIAEFFVLSIPFTVAMTLPMAVLVSVLYAFSRLASENEITAIKASGVSLNRTLVPVLWGAATLAAVMIGFHDQVLPRANHQLRVLQGDIARKKPTFALREQVINEVASGKFYLRANHVDENSNRMREVTIYDLGDPARRRTIYADSGNMGLAPGGSDLELTLWHGVMQEVQKADPSQLQRLFYSTNRIKIRGVGNSFEKSQNDDYKGDREMSICEMQSQVTQAAIERERARKELSAVLAAVARQEATGIPSPMPRSVSVDSAAVADGPAGSGSFGIGRVYCTALGAIVSRFHRDKPDSGAKAGVAVARADSAAPAAQPAATPAASSGSGAPAVALPPGMPKRGLPALNPRPGAASGSIGANGAYVPPPSPSQFRRPAAPLDPIIVSTQISTARQRMEDGAQTMDANEVEIQKKFALSVACVVFVLLGAPIALRFPRGGVGLTIGVSLGVFALYYVGLIAGEALADRDIVPPFVAMWAANILFTIVGLFLMARMGREGSTARGGDAGEFVEQLKAWVGKQIRRVGIPYDRRAAARG